MKYVVLQKYCLLLMALEYNSSSEVDKTAEIYYFRLGLNTIY